ncbi:cbb3-type cytochrome c oxidase subunit 3 [Marinihelvus fidelis]|uniref:Cbb3-type cytochrome c oxidase subunit 3 n=1 Tax=Marinihelvus fidelis TaxID=2613842 RepID=A0A5N0TEQ6_9GAMM|nr:cbb3-type cytochrome c oxidase subunit 3 [Marinihelvus fidelis]KAA9132577.1 cbb3-type cytochrome c oxidase subunit 3 [Marinihelvus fidelis]
MDINILRGILLVLLIIGFVGLFAWAWSRERVPEFEQAARLPLDDDDGRMPAVKEDGA